MVKYAAACALLLIGLAASGSAAIAEPNNDEAVSSEPAKQYDSDNPRIRQEMDRPRYPAATPAQDDSAASPQPASDGGSQKCETCPPPRKHYDKVEVIKNSRDVDNSRVINTESVVHVRPRVKEYNKLVIHENETRNVGTILHNHRIIEKEIRYVKRAPVYRPARPAYRVVERIQQVIVPVMVPQAAPCGCPCTCHGSGLLQAYGAYGAYAYGARREAVQQVLVPVEVPAYGYR